MWSFVKSYLVTFVGIAGAMATLVTFYYQFIPNTMTREAIALAVISFYGFYFFSAHLLLKARFDRNSRYGQALRPLNLGFTEIHRLIRQGKVAEEALRSFEYLADQLATVFSTITSVECSVCIKIMQNADRDHITYETLCRNKSAGRERTNADDESRAKNIQHTLQENTAFKSALHNKTGAFISNRLPLLSPYHNSSFQIYGDSYQGMNVIRRLRRWTLPYKSALVVAIRPYHGSSGSDTIIGFLCIDSPRMGVFSEGHQIEIMQGVADGMYNAISAYKAKL